jgi:hypothetical protein
VPDLRLGAGAERLSRNNVHAVFDRLLTGADSGVITGQLY